MQKNFLTSKEITESVINAGIIKSELTPFKQLLLGIFAGAFIAFGAQAANIISHSINNAGIAKFISGLIFPTGLIMVVIAGAELFTGNSLMIMSLAERKITILKLLRSWLIVYIGNFLGSLLVAYLITESGLLDMNNSLLGGFTINSAVGKITLTFQKAFIRGILCNWLVCLAVFMSFGANDITGKILAIFFPIWLFVASGFEHSIANMYYIPAGIFAASNPVYVEKAITLGAKPEIINNLSWSSLFIANLIPVTLGNIFGGVIFVGMGYFYAHKK